MMCYGAEAAWIPAVTAAVAGTAGTVAAGRAARAKQDERDRIQRDEMLKQADLQKEADQRVRAGIESFTPEKQAQQVQEAVANRTQALNNAVPAPNYQAATVAAPVEVKSDLDRRMGDVATNAKAEGARRAKLAAFGDTSLQQGFDLNRLNEALRRYRMESGGASKLLPYQLATAQDKGQNWALGADLANTIGQAASYYAVGAHKPKSSTPSASYPGGYGDVY